MEVTATGWRPRGVERGVWYGGGPVFPLERVSRSAPFYYETQRRLCSTPDAEIAETRTPSRHQLLVPTDKSTEARAYEYALNLLGARAYTVRALRRKLAQRDFDAVAANAVIERLVSSGLLNDQKFAEEFARQRLVLGGASVRRVEQDLARRGIVREVAKHAVATVVEEENVDTIASMERVARKKLALLGELDEHVRRRRLFGFLARRGYDLEDIRTVVDRLLRG